MTNEEKSRELTRSSFAAQMAMLGYEPNGNPKDMVEVVRCKNCKHRLTSQCPCQCTGDPYYSWDPDDEWFCADGKRK